MYLSAHAFKMLIFLFIVMIKTSFGSDDEFKNDNISPRTLSQEIMPALLSDDDSSDGREKELEKDRAIRKRSRKNHRNDIPHRVSSRILTIHNKSNAQFDEEQRNETYIQLKFNSDVSLFYHQSMTYQFHILLRSKEDKLLKLKEYVIKSKEENDHPNIEEIKEEIKARKKEIKENEEFIRTRKKYIEDQLNLNKISTETPTDKIISDLKKQKEYKEKRLSKYLEDGAKLSAKQIQGELKEINLTLDALEHTEEEYLEIIHSIKYETIPGLKKLISPNHKQCPEEEELEKQQSELEKLICLKAYTIYSLPYESGWISYKLINTTFSSLVGEGRVQLLNTAQVLRLLIINLEFPAPNMNFDKGINEKKVYKELIIKLQKNFTKRLQEDVFSFECLASLATRERLSCNNDLRVRIPDELLVDPLRPADIRNLDPSEKQAEDYKSFLDILNLYQYTALDVPLNPNVLSLEEITKIAFSNVQGGLLGRLINALDEKSAFSWPCASELAPQVYVKNKLYDNISANIYDDVIQIIQKILKRHLNLIMLQDLEYYKEDKIIY